MKCSMKIIFLILLCFNNLCFTMNMDIQQQQLDMRHRIFELIKNQQSVLKTYSRFSIAAALLLGLKFSLDFFAPLAINKPELLVLINSVTDLGLLTLVAYPLTRAYTLNKKTGNEAEIILILNQA